MLSPTPSWTDLAAARGVSVRTLMIATGLSDEAVRLCLRDSRPPKNPVVARIFLRALGLEPAPRVGIRIDTVEQTQAVLAERDL